MPEFHQIDLHLLVRSQSDGERQWWTAQCLEFDICAQAETLSDLEHEFGRVLVGRIVAGNELGIDPWKGLQRAPETAWQAWQTARPLELDVHKPFAPKFDGIKPWMMSPRYETRIAERLAD